MGSGGAFLDADGDGWQDVAARQLEELARRGRRRRRTPALYRNNDDGTFTDVTARVGSRAVEMYGMGVAAADFDNDGWTDVYLTALGGNRLFRNDGRRTVRRRDGERPASATRGFSTSAAWFDYDRDGRLDLFVADYVEWSIEKDLLLHARRQDQVLLHAGVVQGAEPRRSIAIAATARSRT